MFFEGHISLFWLKTTASLKKKNYAFYGGIRRIRILFTPQRHLLDYERIR